MNSETICLKLKEILIALIFLLLAGCSKDSHLGETNGSQEPYVPSAAVDGRAVVAYVTYYGTTLPRPELCTHINYAFAEIYVRGGKYLKFKLKGSQSRFDSVVALKKRNPKLKVLLSFSNSVGNSDNVPGEGFSVLAASEENRKAFAQDCLEFCKEYGIDGIDMDWEFPGLDWSGQAVDLAHDTDNHVLMMKQLRETLGSDYLLTYAGYVSDKQSVSGGFRYIDIKALDPIVDFVNLMTYEMDSGSTPHNAVNCPSAYWDIVRTYRAYMNAGATPSKLVLGIPFYGRVSHSSSPGAITYKTIKALGDGYTIENWDASANVPYVTKNGAKYCYYDNPRSIEYKAKWALERGFYGLMYWENDQDDTAFTLRKAAWEGVMGE